MYRISFSLCLRWKDVAPITRKPFVPLHMPYTALHLCSRSARTGTSISQPFDAIMPAWPYADRPRLASFRQYRSASAMYSGMRGTR